MATKPKQRITNAVGFASVAKSVPEAYLNLMSRFRLKLITSDQELDQAIALARELDSRADLSPVEEEYVEVLCKPDRGP